MGVNNGNFYSLNVWCRCQIISPDVQIVVNLVTITGSYHKGSQHSVATCKSFVHVDWFGAVVASGNHYHRTFGVVVVDQVVTVLVYGGFAVVRSNLASPTEVYHTGLAHRLCIVQHVCDTIVKAVGIAVGGNKYKVALRSHARVSSYVCVGGAATACYTGHVAPVGFVVMAETGGQNSGLRGHFVAIIVTRRRGAAVVLVPNTFHTIHRLGVVPEIAVGVIESDIDNTHNDIFS